MSIYNSQSLWHENILNAPGLNDLYLLLKFQAYAMDRLCGLIRSIFILSHFKQLIVFLSNYFWLIKIAKVYINKAWQSRSTGDLSYWMLFILIGNVSTWLFYGIVKKDLAIIIANCIILFLAMVLLYFKISFKK